MLLLMGTCLTKLAANDCHELHTKTTPIDNRPLPQTTTSCATFSQLTDTDDQL